ncbi:MAG: hypothetical protein CMK59_12915 [Proteobacteria bacterium]|nr:hypothetical protein [Pseudomonadota bacterium]
MASYYRQIDGKRYSSKLLEIVEQALSNEQSTCAESVADDLFAAISSDNRYSDLEKRTLAYIRKNYAFSTTSDAKLRAKIRSWASLRGHQDRKSNDENKNDQNTNNENKKKTSSAQIDIDGAIADINQAMRALQKQKNNLFYKLLDKLFAAYPQLTTFSWPQYSLFFNDGDECPLEIRNISHIHFGDHNYSYVECYDSIYVESDDYCGYVEDQDFCDAVRTINKLLWTFEDTLIGDFGNHILVSASRADKKVSLTTENYTDHD